MGFLGILMLDTRFPRPPGDIGNPVTFEALGIPARRLVVGGAFPAGVVRGRDPALIAPFREHPGAQWVRDIYAQHRVASADFEGASPY